MNLNDIYTFIWSAYPGDIYAIGHYEAANNLAPRTRLNGLLFTAWKLALI